MPQQTAVEWLEMKVVNENDLQNLLVSIDTWFEQAKQMEKKQIVNAWDKRVFRGTFVKGWHIETQNGEEYYNETYNK